MMVSVNPFGIVIVMIAIALIIYLVRVIAKPRRELQQKVDKLEKEVEDLKRHEQ